MKAQFSEHIKKKKSLLKKLIADLSEEFEYVSVLATDVKGKRYEKDFSTSGISDIMIFERGYVARVYNGLCYSEYSFDVFDEENYDEVKKGVIETAKNEVNQLSDYNVPITKYPLVEEDELNERAEYEAGGGELAPQKIMDEMTGIIEEAKGYSELLVNASIRYEDTFVSKAFYSSKKELEQAYAFSTAMIICFVMREGKLKYAYDTSSARETATTFGQVKEKYKKTIDTAIEMLDASPVEPGEYDVICDPDVAGLIAHEAFGHGVEMDMFVKNRAKGAEYMNKYVASEVTRMHDGATSAVDVASYLFDDEGTQGGDTLIIDNGILKAGISDLLSAMQLGTKPTGNGRRESFERKAYARMTNTFFAPGKDKLDEMIGSIKYGYLLEKYDSGMEDPKNWGIQCMISRGREIKEGKLTGKVVGPILLSGYVPDILKSISMVSDTQLETAGSGYCGKGYKEFVKTSIGGTYLKAKARLG
ncbi:MAG: TldD/PmbA family protein [Clostridia bacterium]|nr:TldD/PmbA family protein [Clostridia bacterium]